MVFSSPVFLFLFFPIVFLIYKLLPGRAKNYVLIVASLFFYAWGETIFVVLLLVSIGLNYGVTILLDRVTSGTKRKSQTRT